jgi:DNA repair exonuclease SbcCD ATPase subunit
MIKFKKIVIRNFLSVGNSPQVIQLDDYSLTLILGNNLDMGGNGSRNGVGKSTLLHALAYAIYGQPISSNIKLNNLINKTNKKNMSVELYFEKGGNHYKIIRGRGPTIFEFYVNDSMVNKPSGNEAQGENSITQKEVNKVIGLSYVLFKHIVGITTKTTPFLNEKTNIQKEIIEELLGITELSEKAELLKELVKETRKQIEQEEFRIKLIKGQNEKAQQAIDDLKNKHRIWQSKNDRELVDISEHVTSLMEVEIDIEIDHHKIINQYQTLEKDLRDATRNLKTEQTSYDTYEHMFLKLQSDFENLISKKCHACGQDLHDDQHEEMLGKIEVEIQNIAARMEEQAVKLTEALDRKSSKQELINQLGVVPSKTHYKNLDDAYEHKANLHKAELRLENHLKQVNPYDDQIENLKTTSLTEIDYTQLNELISFKEHQDFLFKLLTDKNSVIRKRIIEKNLVYLNHQLIHYLHKMGLPHNVKFLSDLSVEITKLGQDFDFDNLSTGESTRLILSLSMAFRDVFENTKNEMNILFIDELVDNGMDTAGGEAALSMLKYMARDNKKNVFLISHKDEFVARVNTVLLVTKENDFTDYSYEESYEI